MRRAMWIAVGVLVGLFVVIQLIPYQVHNPPITLAVQWDTPQTAELARRACYDCHSNEVRVPWYGRIAPISWLLRDHVDEAREALNFSEMDRPYEEADEAGEEVSEGEMPPFYYLWMHPDAQLTAAETRALVTGLNATLGGEHEETAASSPHDEDEDEDEDHRD